MSGKEVELVVLRSVDFYYAGKSNQKTGKAGRNSLLISYCLSEIRRYQLCRLLPNHLIFCVYGHFSMTLMHNYNLFLFLKSFFHFRRKPKNNRISHICVNNSQNEYPRRVLPHHSVFPSPEHLTSSHPRQACLIYRNLSIHEHESDSFSLLLRLLIRGLISNGSRIKKYDIGG